MSSRHVWAATTTGRVLLEADPAATEEQCVGAEVSRATQRETKTCFLCSFLRFPALLTRLAVSLSLAGMCLVQLAWGRSSLCVCVALESPARLW